MQIDLITWEDYGISKNERKRLRAMCEDERYKAIVHKAAEITEPMVAYWIEKSVTEHKTFEKVCFENGTIPVCRTYFYGYRRRFYYIFKQLINVQKKDKR